MDGLWALGRPDGKTSRHNPADTHGVVRLISVPPLLGRPAAIRATSSDSSSSPAMWNGERPAATTTNGSAATTSVHYSAGSETSSPAASTT